jgi:hypothetical protein
MDEDVKQSGEHREWIRSDAVASRIYLVFNYAIKYPLTFDIDSYSSPDGGGSTRVVTLTHPVDAGSLRHALYEHSDAVP